MKAGTLGETGDGNRKLLEIHCHWELKWKLQSCRLRLRLLLSHSCSQTASQGKIGRTKGNLGLQIPCFTMSQQAKGTTEPLGP